MPKPIVNNAKCIGCGSCVQVCPVNVFVIKGKKSTVARPNECIGCRACEASCPSSAIKIED